MANGVQQAAQHHTRAWLSGLAGYGRPVLVGLLMIVVLAGARAARPADSGIGPLHRDVLPLAVGLELVLAVLLVALWLLARRRPKPGYPADALRAGLLRAIVLGMVTIAVLAGLSHLTPRPRRTVRPPAQSQPKPLPPRGLRSAAPQHGADLTYLLYALLALLLLAAIVACVLVILRRMPAGPVQDVLVLPEDDDDSLRDAIESGRRALRSYDDAQAAIIACYVAMEASLASAGTARDAAETPDELLARAVGSGLLHGRAAGRLTALFYEARYSSHAMPATARDEAVRALDAISADLARLGADSRLPRTPAQGPLP